MQVLAELLLNLPCIIIPYPFSNQDELDSSVASTKELCDYYGVGYINTNEYMWSLINDGTENHKLSDYFNTETMNVHPLPAGYRMIGQAVTEALRNEPNKFFKPYNEEAEQLFETASYQYRIIYPNSDRLIYSGDWTYQTAGYTNADYPALDIQEKMFTYPYAPNGIMQSSRGESTVELTTLTNELVLIYLNPSVINTGNVISYYIEGVKAGQFDLMNSIAGNFSNKSIKLDGYKHTVKIVTEEPANGQYIFNLMYISERQ